MRSIILVLSTLALGLAGCNVDASVSGQATYIKPASEGGHPVAPQDDGELSLTVSLAGEAVWDETSESSCTLTQGNAEGRIEVSGVINPDGSFVVTFALLDGSFSSPDDILCGGLEQLRFVSLSDVQISASIPADEENCNDFCQARAEIDCEGAPEGERCIEEVRASCDPECSQAERILGTGQITTEALDSCNDELEQSSVIAIQVDLVFDTLE